MNRLFSAIPQLDVLALGGDFPVQGREDPLVLEEVAPGAATEDVPPVQPGAEAGRDGDVRRRGHHPVGQIGMPPREIGQEAAECVLGRQAVAGRRLEPLRHGDTRRGVPPGGRASEGHRIEKRLQLVGRHVQTREPVPLLAVGDPHPLLERGHLVGSDEAGVVVLVTGERQAVALDGVGDEGGGPVVLHGAEGVAHRRQVVPAEIGHQPPERVVVVLVEQGADAAGVAEVAQQLLAPRRAPLVGEGRVARVLRGVDPVPQRVSARPLEDGGQQASVLEDFHPPVEVAEDGLEPIREALDHHGVQTLAVVVDDPPDVADVVLPRLHQRLEDVALVELGVARDRDHATLRPLGPELLQSHVVLDERREAGHGHAEADRSGGEIDVVGILRARRVRLRAAESAEAGELVLRLVAQQVLDGVEHRAGVRLHRHPVLHSQGVEVERRHQRRHRRARRLVAADLQPVARGPEVVGVVNHPDSQPQDLAFERAKAAQIGRGVLGKGAVGRCLGGRHQELGCLTRSAWTSGADVPTAQFGSCAPVVVNDRHQGGPVRSEYHRQGWSSCSVAVGFQRRVRLAASRSLRRRTQRSEI